jgi:hypothetical protein
VSTGKRVLNAAYKLLRDLGVKAAIARQLLVLLRQNGFVIVNEKELVQVRQINKQIGVIIKLMKVKAKGKRK